MLSLLLAREAVRLKERSETVSQLHAAVARLHEVQRLDHGLFAHTVRFSPRGDAVLTVAFDRKARIWRRRDGGWYPVLLPLDGFGTDARFSPDGKLVITADKAARVTLWGADQLPGVKVRLAPPVMVTSASPLRVKERSTFPLGGPLSRTWKEAVPPSEMRRSAEEKTTQYPSRMARGVTIT